MSQEPFSQQHPSNLVGFSSPIWNPSLIDTYAEHLAHLSSIKAVTVADSLFDSKGDLLLAGNTVFTPLALNQLRGKVLAKPIEAVIKLDPLLTKDDLVRHLLHVIRDDASLSALHERKSLTPFFETASQTVSALPLVMQKLTVMEIRMHELYQRTLIGTIWGVLIAQEMRLPPMQIQEIFLAGLTHDIGMLHIDPRVLEKKERLDVDEWFHVQGHVTIGWKLLGSVAQIPQDVVLAVYEHHERCDGTGYPNGKVESELSLYGQVLGMADTLAGIYFNRFRESGRNWRDVIAVLEMNRSAYMYRCHEILNAIMSRSELPLADVVSGNDVADYAERLLEKNTYLKAWFAALRDCLTSVGYRHGDRKLHALQNVALHIETTFKGTVLFKEDLRESLTTITKDNCFDINPDLENASVLQQEMFFHLQRLSRMMQVYVNSQECKDPRIANQLRDGFNKITAYLTAK